MTRQNPGPRDRRSPRQLPESDIVLPADNDQDTVCSVVPLRPAQVQASITVEAPPVTVYYVEASEQPTGSPHTCGSTRVWALQPGHLEDDANGNPIQPIAVHPLSPEATAANFGSAHWTRAHTASLTNAEQDDYLRATLPISIARLDAGLLQQQENSILESVIPGWTEPAVRFALGYPLEK